MEKETLIQLRHNGLPAIPVSNVRMKEADRQRIAADIDACIARGGRIQHVDHTDNRIEPSMAFNNEAIEKARERNRDRAASARGRRRPGNKSNDLIFGAQACTRKNAS